MALMYKWLSWSPINKPCFCWSVLSYSEVRLVGGSRCSGRLEILDDQSWVSVCDAAFDQQDAEVVCRELDCGAPVQVLGEDAFGKGDAQMWTQEIQCRGNESQIHLCPTSLYKNSCSHDNYQGLICAGELKEYSNIIPFTIRVHLSQLYISQSEHWPRSQPFKDLSQSQNPSSSLECSLSKNPTMHFKN